MMLIGRLNSLGKASMAMVQPMDPSVKKSCSASPSQPNQPVRK